MATKSFLKNINIKDKNSAKNFLEALEHAEGKKRKKVNYDVSVVTVKDSETIKKLLKRDK